jgi:hypothetical protein
MQVTNMDNIEPRALGWETANDAIGEAQQHLENAYEAIRVAVGELALLKLEAPAIVGMGVQVSRLFREIGEEWDAASETLADAVGHVEP